MRFDLHWKVKKVLRCISVRVLELRSSLFEFCLPFVHKNKVHFIKISYLYHSVYLIYIFDVCWLHTKVNYWLINSYNLNYFSTLVFCEFTTILHFFFVPDHNIFVDTRYIRFVNLYSRLIVNYNAET